MSKSLDICQEVLKYHLRMALIVLAVICRCSFFKPTKASEDETQMAAQS